MLNLKHLFGGLPPAIHDHQLLLVAVGTIAFGLILGYYKGESRKVRNCRVLASRTINANWHVFQIEFIPNTANRKPQLTHIPSTESALPLFSLLGASNYRLDAKKVINAGLKKVSMIAPLPLPGDVERFFPVAECNVQDSRLAEMDRRRRRT